MRGFRMGSFLAVAGIMTACAAQAPGSARRLEPSAPGGPAQASEAAALSAEAGNAAIRKILQVFQTGPVQGRGVPQPIQPGPQVPQQARPQPPGQPESPFAELAKARPDLKPRIDRLESRLGRMSESQQKALSALMWQDVKDKTMSQMLEMSRTWAKDPTVFLARWERMVDQVEAMTSQEQQSLIATLPPEIAQEGPTGGGASGMPPIR